MKTFEKLCLPLLAALVFGLGYPGGTVRAQSPVGTVSNIPAPAPVPMRFGRRSATIPAAIFTLGTGLASGSKAAARAFSTTSARWRPAIRPMRDRSASRKTDKACC